MLATQALNDLIRVEGRSEQEAGADRRFDVLVQEQQEVTHVLEIEAMGGWGATGLHTCLWAASSKAIDTLLLRRRRGPRDGLRRVRLGAEERRHLPGVR